MALAEINILGLLVNLVKVKVKVKVKQRCTVLLQALMFTGS